MEALCFSEASGCLRSRGSRNPENHNLHIITPAVIVRQFLHHLRYAGRSKYDFKGYVTAIAKIVQYLARGTLNHLGAI
jgi:hypothetical protein